MKSLFDNQTQIEIFERIDKLNANSQRIWGTMNVSQMLKHMTIAFSVPIGKLNFPKDKLYYLSANPIARKLMIDIMPWPKNMVTAKDFIVKEDPDFEQSKKETIAVVQEFIKSTNFSGSHPVFGVMDRDTWGKAMYKHFDHHLNQFGV
jgi:hypothetical protein